MEYYKLELHIVKIFELVEKYINGLEDEMKKEILLNLEAIFENYKFLMEIEYNFITVNRNKFFYSVTTLHLLVSLNCGIYREKHPMYNFPLPALNDTQIVHSFDPTNGNLGRICDKLSQI